MLLLIFFIFTIHATKDQEAHHKSGFSKYVADDESKVKVKFSKFSKSRCAESVPLISRVVHVLSL